MRLINSARKLYKKILLPFILLPFYVFSQDRSERFLVRVWGTKDRLFELRKLDFDFASRAIKDYMDLVTTEKELERLRDLGFKVDILEKESDVAGYFDPLYHTYEETIEFLKGMEMRYPHISKLFVIGRSTRFGYPVYAMKISDNVNFEEDEIRILVDGMHHAREPLGNEICLSFIEHLLTRYEVDGKVRNWVNNYEITVIPILNPEGYKLIVDNNLSSPWWRKNLRDNNNNGRIDLDFDGVDLNRNYDINWTWGGSANPSDWTYRGPYPFSEDETKAKRELALKEKFLISVTYHSYGEIVYYPWIWPENGAKAPDHNLLREMAHELANRIINERGDGCYTYERETAANMSPPWMYRVAGTLEFLVEVGTSFIPEGSKIPFIVNSNLQGLFYLLDRASGPGITVKVMDLLTGFPIFAKVLIKEIDDFSYLVPRTTNSRTGSMTRLLQPGKYTILISADGYKREELRVLIDKKHEKFVVFLSPQKEKKEREEESKKRAPIFGN